LFTILLENNYKSQLHKSLNMTTDPPQAENNRTNIWTQHRLTSGFYQSKLIHEYNFNFWTVTARKSISTILTSKVKRNRPRSPYGCKC